jgi:beta-galactosidase/beta-glucuronidase
MEPVDNAHIDTYVAVADIDNQTISVQVDANIADGDVCRIVLLDEGKVVSEAEGPVAVLEVPEMKLWSPDTPHLYDLEISLIRDGKVLDQIKGYTAMRKISHAKDASGHYRMLLNNEVLYQFGPLDQGWWPDGLYTAPCDEALMFDIVKAKEMGFNMIRKHVKVEPARWYWHCDRLGMLVWQDMPNTYDNAKTQWNYSGFDLVTVNAMTSEEGKANFYHEWGEILKANLNFPCIVMWVPFNEAWGQFDTKEVVEFTKSIDDTRLVNYSSGGNFYTDCGGEIHDLHNYPDPVMYLYDPTRVNVLGEYGGIGWPVEGHLWQPDQNWGYIQYKSEEEVLATYEKYAVMLTYLVDWGFGAAIYTQLTDVEGEVNGLMTYDRKVVKLDINRLHEINKMVIKSL